MRRRGEQDAVITGIGQSDVGRRLGRPALELAVDAATEAIADAGLEIADIDGVASFPGAAPTPPGYSEVATTEMIGALGLEVSWYSGAKEVPSQLAAVVAAVAAVATGLAENVLCFRVVNESTAVGDAGRRGYSPSGPSGRAIGEQQWMLPFGRSAANWFGTLATRHFHEFGTTRDHLGNVVIHSRRSAATNPKAIFREPMTMEEYLAGRMISTPFCLYDCDVPVDGATALVVSSRGAVSASGRAIAVEAVGTALHGPFSYEQYPDMARSATFDAAEMMWSRTELTVADLELACLYDGFSWILLSWLEALGICGRGEAGEYVSDLDRLGSAGPLPLNPHGGQLSAGRTHGFGFIHEACLQLRGGAADRQVGGDPRYAVVSNAGGPMAGCMLLRRP
jgi:acetyl-CoA acetyltransferase